MNYIFLSVLILVVSTSASELGSNCNRDTDCLVSNSKCNSMGICNCKPYFAEYNSTTCLRSSLLGGECLIDAQCALKVSNSSCTNNVCSCQQGFLQFRKHTCLGPAKPGEVCYSDQHCQLQEKKSHCGFLIPKLFGRCQCDGGLRQIGPTCIDEKEVKKTEKPPIKNEPTQNIQNYPTKNSSDTNSADYDTNDTEQNWNKRPQVTKHEAQTEKIKINEEKVLLNTNSIPEVVEIKNETEVVTIETETTQAYQPTQEYEETETEVTSDLDEEDSYQEALKLLEASKKKIVGEEMIKDMNIYEEAEDPLDEITGKTAAFMKMRGEEGTARSLGFSCISDIQCRTADPDSACIDGVCDCVVKDNMTDACGREKTGCHPNTFQCHTSRTCISWFFVCDGREDCPDGSDELCSGTTCPRHAYKCGKSNICVSGSVICDGTRNCPDGEDEADCDVNQRGCPPHSFTCRSGQCVPEYEYCNAVPACSDGSDEPAHICRSHEAKSAKSQAEYCPFRCGNGRCRSTAIVCSGRDGCGDNSDEEQCIVCKCPASDRL